MPERYELDQDLQGNRSLSSILLPSQSLVDDSATDRRG